MELAAAPTGPVPVPAIVQRLAGGDPITPVWRNTLGGLTFRLSSRASDRFVKWMPTGTPGVDAEVARLGWAGSFVRVPRVIDWGDDATGSWMLTAGMPGDSAIDARFVSNDEASRVAARAIGVGLRELHDRLPVQSCPYSWSVESRIARARAAGLDLPVALDAPPPVDLLVVCHGDACAPNTLVSGDGAFAGHVDLGSLGTGDRWADLAIATWSLEWNFAGGEALEDDLLDAYGIARDETRIGYYRALWAAT